MTTTSMTSTWPTIRSAEGLLSVHDLVRASGRFRSHRDAFWRLRHRRPEIMEVVTMMSLRGRVTPTCTAAGWAELAPLFGIGEVVGLGVGVGDGAVVDVCEAVDRAEDVAGRAVGGDLSIADAESAVTAAVTKIRPRRSWHWSARSGLGQWKTAWCQSPSMSVVSQRPAAAGLGEVLRLQASAARNRLR